MNTYPQLPVKAVIDGKMIMNTAIEGNYLFFGGDEIFCVADISNPSNPQLIAKLYFRATCRQLAVWKGYAYITSRHQGVWIFDVRDPYHPAFLCHYDSVELATGVCVSDNLLFIAQRQYGVEIVDITDHAHPKHITVVRTIEAQSVCYANGYIYAGEFHKNCVGHVSAVDVRDPYNPVLTESVPLDGYGDGVDVYKGRLFVSTGHHSEGGAMQRVPPEDPRYGKGHGLEIFDLSDPAHPAFISRVKFPPFYMKERFDMWSVEASDKYACCADTYNGFYLVDISDITNPFVVGYHEGFVGGSSAKDGYVYLACGDKGLVCLDTENRAVRPEIEERYPLACVVPQKSEYPENEVHFKTGGQFRSVSFIDEYLLAAGGTDGLFVAKLRPNFEITENIKTSGIAFHVEVMGGNIFLAEGDGGLTVWKHTGNGKLALIGRWNDPELNAIHQIKAYLDGKYAIVQAGKDFVLLDITDVSKITEIARDHLEALYWDHITAGTASGRYTTYFDHPIGMRKVDFEAEGENKMTKETIFGHWSFSGGSICLGNYMYTPLENNLWCLDLDEYDFKKIKTINIDGFIGGKPAIYGNYLVVLCRHAKKYIIADISKGIENSVVLEKATTEVYTGIPAIKGSDLIIPEGYNGITVKYGYMDKYN